jgi:hypothetical protein
MTSVAHLKNMLHKNYFCGAPKICATESRTSVAHGWTGAPQNVDFLWHMWLDAPQNFHGPTRGPALHMGEENSVAHGGMCATELLTSVAHQQYAPQNSAGFFLPTQLHPPPPPPHPLFSFLKKKKKKKKL